MLAGNADIVIEDCEVEQLRHCACSCAHHAHFIFFLKHFIHNKDELDAGIADVAIHFVVLCGVQHTKVGVKHLPRRFARGSNCTKMILVSRLAEVTACKAQIRD